MAVVKAIEPLDDYGQANALPVYGGTLPADDWLGQTRSGPATSSCLCSISQRTASRMASSGSYRGA